MYLFWLYPTVYNIVHETVTGYIPLEDITVDGVAIAKKFKKQLLASIIYTLHLHVKDSLKIIVEDDDEETAVMSVNQNSSKWRYLKWLCLCQLFQQHFGQNRREQVDILISKNQVLQILYVP